MKLNRSTVFAIGISVASLVAAASAQQAPPNPKDPRIGLKAGLRDAGTAALNMELLANLPKPEGFFDPEAPAGSPTPPERAPGAPPEPTPAPGHAATPAATRLGLHEFRPRLLRHPRRGRQLSRLQHLRRRERPQAAADDLGGLPRWAG